jgi:rRNA maturation endonuclease Nob1|tara:strand:+ start:7555 stop:7761 length:207 start_codon:yes stop_codon:yes gene_type:complete
MTLTSFANEVVGCVISNNLLQNNEALTFKRALIMSKKYILRWRFRVCNECNREFDIEEQGFGYNCGCF